MKKRYLLAALAALSFNANAVLLCDFNLDDNIPLIWRVGDGNPYVKLPDGGLRLFESGDVLACQAWGKELEYIQKNFTGLRGRKGTSFSVPEPTIVYTGDDAVFIVNNL